MDIHHLKIFLAVYKNKSFSKAGEELLISQPTVSEHIKFLENYLKKRLFDRIGRRVYPTESAKELYSEALKIVEEFENLINKLTEKKTDDTEIDILASSVPGNYILPRILASFKKLYKNSILSIKVTDSTDVINKVLKDEGLIGFIGTKINNPKIDQHHFLSDEIVLIAEKNFNSPATISAKDIPKLPLIIRESGSGTRKEFEKFLERVNLNPASVNVSMILESNESVKQAVIFGAGVSFISKFCIESELKDNRLKIIRIKEGEIKRSFYWIKKRGRTLPQNYLNFIEFIKNNDFKTI